MFVSLRFKYDRKKPLKAALISKIAAIVPFSFGIAELINAAHNIGIASSKTLLSTMKSHVRL